MKILKIVPNKYKRETRTVFLEGGGSFKAHEEVVAQYHLYEGMEIGEGPLADVRRRARVREGIDYAYLFLSYRDRSSREMHQRLRRKGFDEETAQQVVAELKGRKLIDDTAFAQNLVESKLKHQLLGKARIEQDLFKHGLDKKTAEHAIEQIVTEHPGEILSEEERAYQLLQKRRKQLRSTEPHTLQRRLFEHLLRRGFSYDTAERALSRFRKERSEARFEEGTETA